MRPFFVHGNSQTRTVKSSASYFLVFVSLRETGAGQESSTIHQNDSSLQKPFSMKPFSILALILLFAACSAPAPDPKQQAMQARIDSLEKNLANAYKPGFGEFMSA